MPYTGKFQVFEDIIKEIMIVYKHDSRPWLIGYSGGKDSTLLVSLVYPGNQVDHLWRVEPGKYRISRRHF